jgi:hypothetical protein
LGRGGTAHNGRNLATVNRGNYDLVIIDESRNFRNNNPVKDKEADKYGLFFIYGKFQQLTTSNLASA